MCAPHGHNMPPRVPMRSLYSTTTACSALARTLAAWTPHALARALAAWTPHGLARTLARTLAAWTPSRVVAQNPSYCSKFCRKSCGYCKAPGPSPGPSPGPTPSPTKKPWECGGTQSGFKRCTTNTNTNTHQHHSPTDRPTAAATTTATLCTRPCPLPSLLTGAQHFVKTILPHTCGNCVASDQCEEGFYCCPYMKKCIQSGSTACYQPIANCNPRCYDNMDVTTTCTLLLPVRYYYYSLYRCYDNMDPASCTGCQDADFPNKWVTCPGQEEKEALRRVTNTTTAVHKD